MKIKGKFDGQLFVMLEFSARDQRYRVTVVEWGQGRKGYDWFKPVEHLVYDDLKGFPHEKWFPAKRRTRALRYFAKVKAEQAFRHASHQQTATSAESWGVIAR